MRIDRPFRAPGFRRTLPAALLVVLAVSAVCSEAGDKSAPAEVPPLAVTPGRADLGEVRPGDTGTLEFTFANSTNEAIRLIYIFAECDCSFDLPASGAVPPGGTFLLSARYHLEEVEGGGWDEMITVLTDDPRQQEIHIPITAFVLAETDADSGSFGG